MKNLRLLFFACFLGCFLPVLSYAQGVFIPPRTVFGTVNGITRPIAGATVTVCAANTPGIPCSPALANTVFKDQALTVPLSNPFTADANGNYPQAALAGGTYTITESAVGFSGFSAQVTVTCAPGAPCTIGAFTASSATITGALTVGGLIQCKNFEQVRCVDGANSAGWAGADAGAWIASACNDLPATGGTTDARALQGVITFSSDWLNSITKPCTILLGNVTLTGANTQLLTISSPNITIVGIGNGTTGSIIKSTGAVSPINSFVHVTAANVTLRNLRIDTSTFACGGPQNGLFVDTGGTSFTADGVYFLGSGSSDTVNCGGVNIQANLYTVKNSTFDSISGTSIAVGVSTIDGQVLNNLFLSYVTGIVTQSNTNNTLISGNIFQNTVRSGIVAGLDAILLGGSGHITISNNIIKQTREHGIYVASAVPGTVPNTQIVVTGNNIFTVPGVGIKFHATSVVYLNQQSTVSGNIVSCGSPSSAPASTSEGFQFDEIFGLSVTGNIARFCQTGFDIEGDVNGITFGENTSEYNNAAGFFLRDVNGPLQNLTFENNHANNNNVTLGGFGGFHVQPDNGGVGGGTNVNTNIMFKGNSAHDYQTTFPAQSTTAGGASVTSNVATLTMVNNPIGDGFFVNAQAVVSGFTGADTIYNGTFTVTAVTSTSISYALVHANVGSSTTGSVTMAATQTTSMTFLGPSNGSSINTVHAIDNQVSNISSAYAIGTGYTTSYLRYTGSGSPNSPANAFKGWIGSNYNRTDGPPWTYCKATGDGTATGWRACAPTNRAMASSSGAITTNVQGQPGGMTAFTWNVDAGATYNFTCELFYQISSVTGVPSPAMAVGGGATYTSLWAAADGYQTAALTTAGSVVTAAASASTLVTTASTPVTTNLPFRFRGEFVVNAAGTFLVTAANSLNAGASMTIGSGGTCSLYQVQ